MTRDLSTFIKSDRIPDGKIDDLFNPDLLNNIPDCPGIYIVVSQSQKFVYPNGQSKVIYMGMSKSLHSRILQHHKSVLTINNLAKSKRNKAWHYSRHQYMSAFGAKVYYYTIRGTQDPKNLEEKFFEYFYDRYYSLPVGNGAFSFRKQK